MSRRSVLALVVPPLVASLVVLPLVANAQPGESSLLTRLLGSKDAPLKRIACIVPSVVTQGTTGELGLRPEALTSHLGERLVAGIPGIEVCEGAVEDDPEKLEAAGFVLARVWTVGNDFPIALHVRMEGGVAENAQIFLEETLGFTEKKAVDEKVRETLSAMSAAFAARVVAARGGA